jgi:predicted RNA-binding Zn-ribbon protein involved in translation (DUF1610 family)
MTIKEFYTCSNCGRAISGEKKEFFVCPNCGRALCQKKDLKQFDDNFCGNCLPISSSSTAFTTMFLFWIR